jgi:hypothetical protein
MGRSKKVPKKPHRSKGLRFTVEQQQEDRSRAQFGDRLTEFGWVVNPKVRDLGEDFVIDIYDAGNSAGLLFLAQIKSTEDASRFVPRKKNATISYRLEVHDLEHWEVAAQLVVIFIWDMAKKSGVCEDRRLPPRVRGSPARSRTFRVSRRPCARSDRTRTAPRSAGRP